MWWDIETVSRVLVESLGFPELDEDNTRRIVAIAASPSGKPDS